MNERPIVQATGQAAAKSSDRPAGRRAPNTDLAQQGPQGTTPPESVRCMVLTVSDTRTLATDEGGGYLARRLAEEGYGVMARHIVADEVADIRAAVLDAVESGQVDALVVTGGTGVAPRDVTPDAVVPLFTKHLPGFGEVFRQISYANMGPQAILSRADAGVITRTLVFILPGSPKACELAIDELISPILGHAIFLLRKSSAPAPLCSVAPLA